MTSLQILDESQDGLSRTVENALESEQLASRTRQCYTHWICRFFQFHDLPAPDSLEQEHARAFIIDLAERLRLSRARLNQAEKAMDFLYCKVLGFSHSPCTSSMAIAG